jgi:hypothetical protein
VNQVVTVVMAWAINHSPEHAEADRGEDFKFRQIAWTLMPDSINGIDF